MAVFTALLFCYLNNDIFEKCVSTYLTTKLNKHDDIVSCYRSLPSSFRKRYFLIKLDHLKSNDCIKRKRSLGFFQFLSTKYPYCRRAANVGFYDETDPDLFKERIFFFHYGINQRVISEKSAKKYHKYFVYGLKDTKDRDIIITCVWGLASAFRNNETEFKKYVWKYNDHEDSKVRGSVYLYTWYYKGMKGWRDLFTEKLKYEKDETCIRNLKYYLDDGKITSNIRSLFKEEREFK